MRLLLKFVLPCLFTVLWAEASAYSLKSKSLAGIIDLKTSLISIGKTNGKKIADEEPFESCKFQHAVLDGKQYYHLTQSFQSPGHCAGHYRCVSTNYRGRQVRFFQNITKVVIPFYLAGQTCDVSLDNYSLAKRGDGRLSNPLFELILFSGRRKAGWLQASHRNDQSKMPWSRLKELKQVKKWIVVGSKLMFSETFIPERRKSITGKKYYC